jgi:hypothetical protein
MFEHTTLNLSWYLSPRIPLTWFLHHPWSHCHCWSDNAQPVTAVLFIALTTMEPVSEVTSEASAPSVFLRFLWICRIGDFYNKKFSHHTLPSRHVHNICRFVLLLCWMHVTDWSTDNTGGTGQCCYPVGKARNSTQATYKRKKIGGIIFIPTFVCTNKYLSSHCLFDLQTEM